MPIKCRIALLAVLSCFSLMAAEPTHLSCSAHHKVKLERPVPISIAGVVKAFTQSVTMFEPPVQSDKGAQSCPWLAEVHRWIAWRQRNPNAPSRFPNAPKSLSAAGGVVYFGPTTADAEPDPSGLGCGCEFYESCGYWHTVFG